MAWLAKLDDRARQWPLPLRWVYLAIKWYLVVVGAFGLLMWMLKRAGLPSLMD